jgi:putative tricarboxylic transport membrane protein
MLEGIITGFVTAITVQNLFWVVIGCLAGTMIGMLPGLGPITAIALMIPLAYGMDPAGGMIMMAGVYYGAVFGGSTSSILINAPGIASTVATSFDGYPMAQRGEAGRALAIAAYSSFLGGTIGALLLVLTAGFLARVALHFQSPEYALLMIFALISVAVFAERGALLKSLITAVLGLMLATVGTDQGAGVQRFTFGQIELIEGISFVLIAMAAFALAEALRLGVVGSRSSHSHAMSRVLLKRSDLTGLLPAIGRSSLLGFVVGVLPGAGATLASFFAYDAERRIRRPDAQPGDPAGIAAPESANNAACTGSFVPLLSLGIPGSGTTAVLLGVMIAYGIQPGPQLITTEPAIFWGVIVSMYIGNLVLLLLNFPLIPYLARIIHLSPPILVPFVLLFALLGVYLTSLSAFDLYLMLAVGVAAFVLRLGSFPLAPLLLGFILGGLLEDNLRRTLMLYDNSLRFIWERPQALVVAVFILIVLSVPLWRAWQRHQSLNKKLN